MSKPIISRSAGPLRGIAPVPGDKSISHRSLILGAMANGTSRVRGLLAADDVLRTATAVRQLGAEVERDGDDWVVTGAPWATPDRTIYCGNAGTGSRLLMGAVAGQNVAATFDGDRSLRSRPMGRIIDPLSEMGVKSDSADGKLPVTIHAGTPSSIRFRLPKPSAQIKSAVMLAALGASGTTVIEEPEPSRDHTERMLPFYGSEVDIGEEDGVRTISVVGGRPLHAADIEVPRDPSSSAFPLAAALICPGSQVEIPAVMLNPHRVGLIEILKEMQADISISNERPFGGEQVGDLTVRASALTGVTVPPDRAPSMIDEYPILAVIAARAKGTTRMEGLAELRVKESDRIAATEALLMANGVTCRSGPDWLEVDGADTVPGGGTVVTHDDHRIAMSALVLGTIAENPVTIDNAEMIDTSFTGFADLMNRLGASISMVSGAT